MTLGEMLKRAVHSDRLIIREADGREIYRGYVACMQYHGEIDPARGSEAVRPGNGHFPQREQGEVPGRPEGTENGSGGGKYQ